MTPVRILLGALPAVVRNALEGVLTVQVDMEVIGATSEPVETLMAAGQARADVVVLGLQDSGLPGLASLLLDEYPHLKVVAVAAGTDHALLYELHPRLVRIPGSSPEELVDAIRVAVGS